MKSEKLCPVCGSKNTALFLSNLYDDRFAYPQAFNLLECKICTHKFLDADFSTQALGELYTQYYPRSQYDVNSHQPLKYKKSFKSWFNGEDRAYSLVPENVTVLDVGCGFGESVSYHKNRGCLSYGCEADENAKRVADKFHLNIKIGTFENLDYENNFFDYITMDQVFEHTPNPLKTLQHVREKLKPSGQFIITFPNASGWGARTFKNKWLHWHKPYHLQFYTENSLKLLAEKANMKLITYKTHTSSEWLLYQKIHLTCFPDKGTKSPFFNSGADIKPLPESAHKEQEQVRQLHSKKWHHALTRFYDFIGQGDNVLAVLVKK